jgi:hypothetical protein
MGSFYRDKMSVSTQIIEVYGFLGQGDTQIMSPNPDIETGTLFPMGHCEHLEGACLHAEVLDVSARRRGNLMEKGEIHFARNDDF